MPHDHGSMATMYGLARHPDTYRRLGDRIAGPLYRRVVRDVVAAVARGDVAADARVLDVGTGPGTLPLLLAEALPRLQIHAVDLVAEMVDAATARGRACGAPVHFQVGDVAALPFADASIDLVVSTLSQHHWQDPVAGFRDILRVVRPGGVVWVYDARPALRRAEAAARDVVADGPAEVHRESPLVGSSWLQPMGRVVVRAATS